MRIVIVKPIIPWPAVQGTRRVTVGLLKALAPVHDVTLVAPSLDPADMAAAGELERRFGIRVITEPAPNRRSAAHRAWYRAAHVVQSGLGGHSPRALYATPGSLLRRAHRELGPEPVDLAIFEYWYTYRAFGAIPARRRVLLAHDADFQVAAGRRPRPFDANESRREAAACRAVDAVWALTRADAAALAQHAGIEAGRFRILPFGVDTAALDVPAGAASETVLFFGAYQADFNRDALRHLVDDIWPRIQRARPAARLEVAGGGLPPELANHVRKAGGTVTGRVEDLGTMYGRAAVVMIPLRFGGGLRIRLLEALAARRAVVATSVGIGGLAGGDGVHWLTGRTAGELAAAAVHLLADPEQARRLGEAGRVLVCERHSEARAIADTRALVESLI